MKTPTKSNNDYYTPDYYIKLARSVMGGIDLDVASCEFANKVVRATKYYTKRDNGLMHSWHGRIWCNPPYGKTTNQHGSYLEHFSQRLIDQYERGNVEQAVLLIPNSTGTSWFPALCKYPLCFPPYRLRFYTERGMADNTAAFSSVFIYFGNRVEQFTEIFSSIGPILGPISAVSAKLITRELWTEVEG